MDKLPTLSQGDINTLASFLKGLPQGETVPLDPSNGKHNAAMRISLGAGGFTPDKYPAIYTALDRAQPTESMPEDKLLLTDAGKTPDGKATATVWASAGGATLVNGGVLLAFDPERGDLVACGENASLKNGFLTCPTRAAQAKPAPKALAMLHVNHVTDPAGNTRFFAMSQTAEVGTGIQANVTQPVITKSGHSQIEICVGRMLGYQNNDCDYVYEVPSSVGNETQPYLVCPFVGKVGLSGTPNLAAVTASNLITNIVVDDGAGGSYAIDRASQYTSDAELIAGLSAGSPPNVLNWSYPFDGPSHYFADTTSLVYNKSNLQSEIVSFFFFMFDIPMQNGLPNQTFYVCSKDSPEIKSVNCTVIDNLLFWWHCAVAGTPVTLDSGKILPIEQVNNGHRVQSADGKNWAVRATRHGAHKSTAKDTGLAAVYRMETDNGYVLSASGAHTIALADGGLKQIADIAGGDKVLTIEGPARVSAIAAIDFDGICHSLAIGDDDERTGGDYPADAAIYFAGGIGSGDHMAMRAQTDRARNDLDAIKAQVHSSLHVDCTSAHAHRRF